MTPSTGTATESNVIVRQQTSPEEALVASAIRGDRGAMAALWQCHRRWVAAVLLAHKPAEAELEDLLQEVAVRLVGRVSSLREESNLRAWLRAVAVNVARSAARRRPVPPAEIEERPEIATTPEDADGERTRWLMRRLEQLPSIYREPLMLRAVQGMRSRQIASILDLPPATVDTRIARARKMLRGELDRIRLGASEHEELS